MPNSPPSSRKSNTASTGETASFSRRHTPRNPHNPLEGDHVGSISSVFPHRSAKKAEVPFVSRHSAVKRCRWFYETVIHDRPCYKQKFYGIKTHQCIQMTPAAFHCTQQCLFCWRVQNRDLQTSWNELRLPNGILRKKSWKEA